MRLIAFFLIGILVSSCGNTNENIIANSDDYNRFLTSNASDTNSKYFELWNSKIREDSMQLTSFGIVGSEYSRYFKETGEIDFLKKAEQSLKRAVKIAAIGKPGFYRALARNYISQHRFKEALELTNAAAAIGGGKNETQSLYFDIHMELGNYDIAEKYLDSIKNMSDFGYMIRLAKWNDYKGDLSTTIKFMEQAAQKAITSKNKELMLWSFTNLGDYYGHAGRIGESYEHYLKALNLDGSNAYAKKGIAWIVFSHDKKPKEALRILDSVTKNYNAPDYFLLKAEIAEFMDNDLERSENLDNYLLAVNNPAYGAMYNTYNIGIYLEYTNQVEKAIALSKQEVNNRPTPESYGYLAYSLLKNGENERAMDLVSRHIENKTYEPQVLFYAAQVYKANERMDKVNEIKEELTGAIYELGPGMEKQIHDL